MVSTTIWLRKSFTWKKLGVDIKNISQKINKNGKNWWVVSELTYLTKLSKEIRLSILDIIRHEFDPQ